MHVCFAVQPFNYVSVDSRNITVCQSQQTELLCRLDSNLRTVIEDGVELSAHVPCPYFMAEYNCIQVNQTCAFPFQETSWSSGMLPSDVYPTAPTSFACQALQTVTDQIARKRKFIANLCKSTACKTSRKP